MEELLKNLKSVIELDKCIKKENFSVYAYNSVINNDINLVWHLFKENNRPVIFVCPNIYKTIKCYESLVEIAGLENVNLYCMDDFTTTEVLASSPEYKEERLFTISSIINKDKKIVVTNLGAILRPIQSIDYFKEAAFSVGKGDSINTEEFCRRISKLGYKRVSKVEQVGDFSLRGEVIDIFPLGETLPLRIDLFDTEIETIKYFSIDTQRSIQEANKILIYPVSEIIIDNVDEFVSNITDKVKSSKVREIIEQDINDIENYNLDIKILKYLGYSGMKLCSFIDYFESPLLCYLDVDDMKKIELHLNEIAMNSLNSDASKELCFSTYMPFIDVILNRNNVYMSEFKNYFDFPLTDLIDFSTNEVYSYQGNIAQFFKENNKNDDVRVYINDDKYYQLFADALEANKKPENISINKGKVLSVSYNINGKKLIIVGEDALFKRDGAKEKKYRSNGVCIRVESKDEIEPGDYVVHYDYGIAKYAGLKSVELNGIINDYLLLQFDSSELYVPVENISILDKYQGSEGHVPRLSHIGNGKWEKKKAEIRTRLKEIAGDLIKIQATRESSKGFEYSKDTDEQKLFESDFEYEETNDQLETIKVIKEEMEKGQIIDRLICGDVGYGKTEVAMRAAFKTIMDGKQVAYLAPTTILSRQHYFTFKERMEKFGINIAIINRFVSKQEISKIYDGVRKGTIDILIGTHAILNDAISYRDLGLLIIDEEQRFGVEHKEKIKKLKNNVNVLTLTATPIPRTLQLSLVGVRELSLIQTPPKNRFPVKTYVIEENDLVIKEAIYTELARNGQVFYLHNKVSDLERVYTHLQELVPEARIAIGHGQMDKDALEDVVQSFIDHEIDVLLCTTIIETGIDIPNSNTLIVDMADKLGLAQMYQLRGRVGRSDKISYAYFTYDKKGVLTENSAKRLLAIKEFTSLGSGYKIALRDLSIRGAGDILGREQSGFIDDVGMDLYMRLLDEEVKKIKGQTELLNIHPTQNIAISKHVSDKYVSDEDIKIYIHKQINNISNDYSKEDLINELVDRFGELTPELYIYVEKKYLDYLASECYIEKVNDYVSYVQLVFNEEISDVIDAEQLFCIAYTISANFSFEYKARKIIVKYNKKKDQLEWLKTINTFLSQARFLVEKK